MRAELEEIRSGSRTGLDKEKTYIGRNPGNDLVSEERHVSRRHCAVIRIGTCYFLENLKSLNGTYLNGRKIEEAERLKNGDTISLGSEAPVYRFRTYRAFPRAVKDLLFNPKHSASIAAAGLILFGLFYSKSLPQSPPPIDASNGLLRLERAHGGGIVPDNPALLSVVGEWVEKVKLDESLRPTLEWRLEFKDMIESTLRANNLPADYALIVWAESQYNLKARNPRTGAAGMWQLLPSTARAYGLRVDDRVDERLDPAHSTRAAALYLKDLVSIFGNDSFLLVLAAYNAGDNAVLYGLKKIEDPVRDRNFWYLYSHDLIPDETKAYVMKILALAIVSEET